MNAPLRSIRCTITGADDLVDPDDLVVLSREYPFVEWAILISASRAGTPRYPSSAWLERLQNRFIMNEIFPIKPRAL